MISKREAIRLSGAGVSQGTLAALVGCVLEY